MKKIKESVANKVKYLHLSCVITFFYVINFLKMWIWYNHYLK